MPTFRVLIAEKTIEVSSIYDEVRELCCDYMTDGEPDFKVQIVPEDLTLERERSIKSAKAEGRDSYNSSDSYLETLAVYRKICEKMPLYDTILFHGSCIEVDGQAFLFSAKSGTGKSTHTRLWRELLGERAVMINDDKPLLKVTDSGVTVFGTPYNGKHRLGCNSSAPLKAIAVLERSEHNTITKAGRDEYYSKLLQQLYRPFDPLAMTASLMLMDKMLGNTELYRLGCNMDIEAAEIAYNAMKG